MSKPPDMTLPPSKMRLVDWLDDLCVRFIVNLPREELESVERICFQIEEAQWFYEDFLRPLDPSLPSMNLRRFSLLMFQHCPLSADYSEQLHVQAYEQFLAYKTRVPVRGAIMLNQDMTHAVLVKGWKKGAKWSFPRGKINKDEPNLDCAVREVYEETGYDLKTAGLVGPDEQMKKIGVSMREQDMMLYVFRGVPMDTYFEPRTRKEISKIDWYSLTDLPTLKKKNQYHQPMGHDLIRDNNFYMVAPFLGPLKSWIKQQHKLDRQKLAAGTPTVSTHAAPSIPVAMTDTELEVDVNIVTSNQNFPAEKPPADESFADLVAKLGRSHRASDALPEVSAQPEEAQVFDQAEQLKRLLNVGLSIPLQESSALSPPFEQPPTQNNPLLAMLHGTSQATRAPRTPMDQFIPPPNQPHSPHGQHHPRPPHLDRMAPPPPFSFQPQHNLPFRGPQLPQFPQQHPAGAPIPFPRHFDQPPPHHPASMFTRQEFGQGHPRPYQQTGDPQFLHSIRGAAPPASNLPPPKLTPHTMNLLNSLKSQEKPASSPVQLPLQTSPGPQIVHQAQPAPQGHQPRNHFNPPKIASPPLFQSPPPIMNAQNLTPAQPKPRSAHQDSLLNLFHASAGTAATPPPPKPGAEPAELSALPTTPGHPRLPNSHTVEYEQPGPAMNRHQNLLEAFFKPGLTSATVSGPVNVPDFETVKKNTHGIDGGPSHSRGPSPNQPGPQQINPQQILSRNGASKPVVQSSQSRPPTTNSQASSNLPTPQASAFKPQILRRPQSNASPALSSASPLLALFNSSQTSPLPAAAAPAKVPGPPQSQQSFDRRETLAPDQKNALLSLFGKPASVGPQPKEGNALSSNPPSRSSRSPLPTGDVAHQQITQPPTPKSAFVSGVISPVSPLPADKDKGSPAHLASRSRISSLGEGSGLPAGLMIPPTSHPVAKGGNASGTEEDYASAGSGDLTGSSTLR